MKKGKTCILSLYIIICSKSFYNITCQELNLEGRGFSEVPSEVWTAGEIIKVDLSKNSIEELPKELSSCASLQVSCHVPLLQFGD